MSKYHTVAFLLKIFSTFFSLCRRPNFFLIYEKRMTHTFSFLYLYPDAIEIPQTILPLGITDFPTRVNVQVLSYIPRCTRVYVEPLKSSDWELLETYADALESGQLLHQVSVVYKNQRLTST